MRRARAKLAALAITLGCGGARGHAPPPAPIQNRAARTSARGAGASGACEGQVFVQQPPVPSPQPPELGSISGLVTDLSSTPIPGVEVAIGRPDQAGAVTRKTDAAGLFVDSLYPPGAYLVRFASGDRGYEVRVKVVAGKDTHLVVRCPRR